MHQFPTIFKNSEKQKEFEENGFCKLCFSNDSLIPQLKTYQKQKFLDDFDGMKLSHYNANFSDNREISENLFLLLENELNHHFINFQKIIAHFIGKKAKFKEMFQLHQDWSYVDEKQFLPIQIWIPLQPTSQLNGGLFVKPKSHLNYNPRSAHFGINMHEPDEIESTQIVGLNTSAQEFICYHPGIFHGSYGNSTQNTRFSVLIAITNQQAEIVYLDKPTKSDELFDKKVISPNFFLKDHFLIQNT